MERLLERGLRVRTARTEDAEAIARILVEAFPELYHMAFGIPDDAKNVAVLTALFAAGHLALDKTRVCEREGRIVGLAILHVGDPIGRGSAIAYARLLRRHLDPVPAARAFFGGIGANRTLVRRMPHGRDLLYIEALAVQHGERGKGVGTLLLQDAFDWALADNRRRVALHVLHGNAGARRLYEKMGFQLWQPTVWHRLRNRLAPATSWSALLMLRMLNEP
jgi:GNAT superfamily N-acetyltransferase